MEQFDIIAVIAIFVLALAFLVRSWAKSLRKVSEGESACGSCPGGCDSGKNKAPGMGSPLGDLRKQG